MKFTLRWHVFVVLLATGFILYSPILIFNTHTFQKWLLSKAMVLDPWQADWKSFRFEPIPPRFKIRGLQITHPQGHSVALDELYLRIKLWHLVKGQLGIDPLRIQNVTVHLAKRPKLEEKEEKKERKFPLSTILLFENLHLDPVQIINTQIYLPNGEVLTIPSFELKLKPVLLRGTSLAINIDNPSFVNTLKKETSLQNIHLEVNTDLKKWRRKFPYLNDLTGDLLITNKEGKEFPFKTIDAKIKFLDNKIFSEKFEIQVGKQPLNGKLETDLVEETYQVTFQTPTGLLIPELESPNRTFDVAGKLTMNMTLEGKGYSLKTSQGKGSLEATHSFDINPEAPVMVKTAFTWSNGAVQIPDAKATTQEATLFARGSIDLSPPALHLKGETKDFPIQRFFEKMNDTNLHPIHGSGDAQATIEGIGDTLHLQVSGEVTDGGYGVLKAEKAVVALEMTSKLLTIGGELFRGDRKTVGADFKITYGKRPFPGAPRPFKTHLDAKFTGEPLDQLLPGLLPSREAARGGGSAGSAGGGGDASPYKTLISGEADATISLDGVEKKIDANGQITVTNGEFEGIVFEKIDVPFHLTEKALTLKTVAIDFPEQHVDWNKPFELRFAPNQIVMTGKPMNGLEIYVIHHNKEKSWEIKKIAWHDPADKKKQVLISGKYSTEALQLTMKGNLDFRDLLFFSQWFYEGSGPVALDLRTDGPVDNLKLFGKVSFNQSAVSIRAVPYSFEKLQGELRFNNKRIATDSFSSMMDGGSFQIKGWLEHANNSVMTACDLSLKGKELYFRDQTGTFRAEYDADLDMKFSSGQQMVSGKIMILSGRYTQDFNLIDEITQGEIRRKKSEAIAKTTKPIFLNLHVHNAGDFVIDNNVGEIEISTNLKIRGSSWRPQVDGSVEVVEGEIHYLGLDFEITSGFMEFRDPYTNPYMEVEGEKDIADAHLKARLYGRTENLRIELSGNLESGETLAQKDVISLILFGVTTTEQQANTGQRTDFGSSVATQQISAVLERPIARTTKLDIFRVETIPDENGEGQTRRLRAGKKVSDRVHLEFTSEVGREDALQTFAVEYWLTDFLILRGSRETEENVQLNIGVRFKAR